MFGRIDDNKFQQGAAVIRNFIAKPQGPAENRPGFAFVKEVKDSAVKTRLLSFTFNTTQTMVIETGNNILDFIHKDKHYYIQRSSMEQCYCIYSW